MGGAVRSGFQELPGGPVCLASGREMPGCGILQSKSPAETGGKMGFISLKFDYAFRTLFSREGVRKQFISDVTGIPLESILYARLESPFLRKLRRRQKQGVLDVAVRLHDGTRIDIEMQVRFQKYWTKRNLFYLDYFYR